MRLAAIVCLSLVLLGLPVLNGQEIHRAEISPRLNLADVRDVTFGTGNSVGLTPGSSYQVTLGEWHCCWYQRPVPGIQATYSIDPADAGITIDRSTGAVSVAPDAWPGTKVRVYASLNFGRRFISQDIYVFDLKTNPLVGRWRQTSEVVCIGGGHIEWPPTDPIRELVMKADGTYSITRHPIELATDYRGPYTFDARTGMVIFGVASGAAPVDFRAQGRVELQGATAGEVVFREVWFGGTPSLQGVQGCGSRFIRQQ